MKDILLVSACAGGLALLAACGKSANLLSVKVEKGTFHSAVVESGELRAVNNLTISAPRATGELKILYLIKEGSDVKQGDKLVTFDPQNLERAYTEAEAQMREAEATLEKLHAEQLMAKRRREQELLSARMDVETARMEVAKGELGLLSKIEVERARLGLERAEKALQDKVLEQRDAGLSANSDIAIQEARRDRAKSTLEDAKRDLEGLEITAPRDGLVVLESNWRGGEETKVQEGDTVWPGGAILALPDLSAMEVVLKVNEAETGGLEKGQRCTVRLDANPAHPYNGVVQNVGKLAGRTSWRSKVKTVEVVVALEKTDAARMKPGMSCQVEILRREVHDALFIPIEAVFRKSGKDVVFRRKGRGWKQADVTLSERNLTHVVVTEGLSEGDEVALSDPTGKSEATPPPEKAGPTRPGR